MEGRRIRVNAREKQKDTVDVIIGNEVRILNVVISERFLNVRI